MPVVQLSARAAFLPCFKTTRLQGRSPFRWRREK